MNRDYEAILQMFCCRYNDLLARWDISTPFKRDDFACAINEHYAAFVPAKLAPKVKERDRTPDAPAIIPKEFTGRWMIPLAGLEEPELDKMLAEVCSFCDDTGRCECQCGDEHDCPRCDGIAKELYYRIYNQVFQYKYIATIRRAFQMLDVDEVEYAESTPNGAVSFTAGELKVILMPVRSECLDINFSYPKNNA